MPWAIDFGGDVSTEAGPQASAASDHNRTPLDTVAAEGDGNVLDTQEVLWQYPGRRTMTRMMSLCNSLGFDFGRGTPARRLGIYFHALNGTLYADYGKCEIVPEGKMLADAAAPPESIPPSPDHEREWFRSLKSWQEPSCGADYHCGDTFASETSPWHESWSRVAEKASCLDSISTASIDVHLPR